MRVLHILALDGEAGVAKVSGAERHLEVLVSAQAVAGVDVHVLVLRRTAPPGSLDWEDRMRQLGATVHAVDQGVPGTDRTRQLRRMRTAPSITSTVREIRPDVAHTHLLYASQIGKVCARAAGVRAIVDSYHNDEPFLSSPTWRIRLRALDAITSGYIAISDAVRRRLVEGVGIAPHRVSVVRYGVVPPSSVLSRAESRARLDLPRDATIVGFVGRLTPQKCVHVLLDAMAWLPEAVGVVIGSGELEEELRMRSQTQKNVRFLGHISSASDYMPAFDVLCLPSAWEGLGLVLLEAMLRDVPVVGAAAGAIPEVLDFGRAGALFRPGDSTALANVLRELLADPTRRRALAATASTFVQTAFSVDEMVARTAAVYERALESSRA